MSKKILAVDLFCGVGGLTRGLMNTKVNVTAGLDVDSTCKYAYEQNNKPSVFIEKDISQISFSDLDEYYKEADIKALVGCTPCQPFSAYKNGKDANQTAKNFSLLKEFARLIEEGKPDIVSLENVPGLVRNKLFHDFINKLLNLNYTVNYWVVRCSDYGIPQSRKRLILLASLKGEIHLAKSRRKKKPHVEYFIKNLPKIEAGEKNIKDRLHVSMKLTEKNIKRISQSTPGDSWKKWDKDLICECHKKTHFPNSYGRMRWDAPAPTITTQFCYYSTGRFGHPEANRAISVREGALLQTFPKNYKFIEKEKPFSMVQIARHIGNAVPVYLGEIVGYSIYSHVNG